jgi:transcriptional regulator with XRE-family HTH domain
MTTTNKKEKLDQLAASARPSGWEEKAKWRKANNAWLKKSSRIAVKVLAALRQQKISQKGLADLMVTSPQYVNKLLSGKENLTLETICRLESLLGIELIAIGGHAITIEVIAQPRFSQRHEFIRLKGNQNSRPLQQDAQYVNGELENAA